jgi:hypothetical protein
MADGVVGSRTPDVVVIGGGIIGAAVARELARGGAAVTVLERDRPGSHASWAAAGMLSPLAEAEEPGPFLDLLLAARERFPALAAELREETSVDVGYLDTGTLFLSLRPEDDAALERRHGWQREAGLAVERLSAGEIRELEPGVSPQLRWGLRFPGDHQVESRALTRALWISARNAGRRAARRRPGVGAGARGRQRSRRSAGGRLADRLRPGGGGRRVLVRPAGGAPPPAPGAAGARAAGLAAGAAPPPPPRGGLARGATWSHARTGGSSSGPRWRTPAFARRPRRGRCAGC